MNELDFIAALRTLPLHDAARGLADDAAVLEIGNETLVLTQDTLVESVHVREGDDPFDIAWKLVAVNLSDLAAMGAKPVGVLISHTLGTGDDRFVEGLRSILSEYDVPLLGGDTVGSVGRRSWTCTAIGRAPQGKVPSRSGAKPGDTVWVCGTLGTAMLGFEDPDGPYADAYTRPVPLLDEGQALAPHVSAMMDVSDGLLLDATRLADGSGVTIDLRSDHLSVADPARPRECLSWGDDYALLFTVAPKIALPLAASPAGFVLPRGEHPALLDGEPPAGPLGYRHG